MKMAAQFLLFSALIMSPASLLANDTTAQDSRAINEALDALQEKNYADTVTKAGEVIQRFETKKDADAKYVCASNPADTLINLFPSKDEENDKKSMTVAIPSDICLAYFLKGFALIDLNKPKDALPFLEEASKLDPDNPQYLAELGEWHKIDKNWPKSLEYFTKASETSDMAIATMQDKQKAREISNQHRCRSYRGIAFNQIELHQLAKAKEALEKCLKLIPNDPKSKAEMQFIEENGG